MRTRRLRSDEIRNLMFQDGDIVSSAASGMSPALIALQQAPQIAQTFAGPGGASVKGALTQAGEAAAGLATRIGLLGGAVGVTSVAIIAGGAALLSYQNRMREVDRLLAGTGRASGASAQQVNAAAVAIAASGEVSVREARSIAATLAATGRIGVEMFVALGRSAKDFAATTGQEVADATQELAQAFADPAKGAQTLNEKLGLLNARTEATVRNLAEQGDRLGAQRMLFEAYSASLSRAADLTSHLGDATSAFGRVASNLAYGTRRLGTIYGHLARLLAQAGSGGCDHPQQHGRAGRGPVGGVRPRDHHRRSLRCVTSRSSPSTVCSMSPAGTS
ncbi:phage tail length tape measure family protein [Methylobacterium nodulans]|uniref:phage tail length tape measure family protein n=1 Tax=Methylobacterium nodulans TaxID=114616 RepID=UPI00016161E6|nr:phage tail length tape measure family protein [Methylobacterium nodulans]